MLPSHPKFGKWELLDGSHFKHGQRVPVNSSIVYKCNNRYKLSKENGIITCLADGWNDALPSCNSNTLYMSHNTF